jgi:HPt (histidine-containing phosphotransfer) domain-containing protein
MQHVTAEATQTIPQGLRALDEVALSRLLALAGPTDAPELMRRLMADLRDVAAGLAAGLANRDQPALRKNSHVLLAVAGTIGAQPVYQVAQLLNQCAKTDDFAAAEPHAVGLLQLLDRLIERLRERAAEPGMGG